MNLIRNFITIIISLFLTLIFLEILLSFMPVSSVIRSNELKNNSNPFDVSSKKNEVLSFSKKFNFINTVHRNTNNLGFFSDFDYVEGEKIVAVIGDSYVEAIQVAFKDTFHQKINSISNHPVYNFAISGSPLSQYEAYFKEVCIRYDVQKLIIAIISNDFSQSLEEKKIRDGFFHYDDDYAYKLKATPYKLSLIRKIANSSNIIRYIYFNLGYAEEIIVLLNNFFDFNKSYKTIEETKSLATNDDLYHKIAIDIFLNNISKYCLTEQDILFVVDGSRPELYNNQKNWHISEYFIEEARNKKFNVINMYDYFKKDYVLNKKLFEFNYDKHWNQYGHDTVFNAINNSEYLDFN